MVKKPRWYREQALDHIRSRHMMESIAKTNELSPISWTPTQPIWLIWMKHIWYRKEQKKTTTKKKKHGWLRPTSSNVHYTEVAQRNIRPIDWILAGTLDSYGTYVFDLWHYVCMITLRGRCSIRIFILVHTHVTLHNRPYSKEDVIQNTHAQ